STAASDGFAPGVLSPTEIDLEAAGIATQRPQLSRLEAALRNEPGVAAVIGPGEQPPPPAPQITLSRDANAPRLPLVSDSSPRARVAAVSAPAPPGGSAIPKLEALTARLPRLLADAGLARPQVHVGGETAVAQATVAAVLDDLKRIGLVALAVNLLLLMLFLR